MKIRKTGNNTIVFELLNGSSVLVSYETPVAAYMPVNGGTYYCTNKKWSATTSRHIKNWLPDIQVSPVLKRDQAFFDELLKIG